ncbi:MAG: gamma-glutamylcyclotransferase family protein [Alsobacter sp.]
MPLYFAYGSNMDRAAMAVRCPQAKPLGLARLPRHRFLITSDGYASVVRDPRRTVHGVLWDLALSDMPSLDRYESLHTGLYTKISQPVVTPGGARRALVYVGRSARKGTPKPGYLEGVLAAARDWGLPVDYVYEMALGEPVPRRPGTPLFSAPR